MIVQIYEIQTPADAEAVVEVGADHVGSVVTDYDRWKNKTIFDTIRMVRQVGAKSSLILLFDDADRISFALDYYRPDIIHFCDTLIDGVEQWEAACGRRISIQTTVKQRFPEIAVMRTIPVPPAGGELPVPVNVLARYFEPVSDYFLADTYFPAGPDQPVSGFIGITGQICDWKTAARLAGESQIPLILAGGLSPDNVYDAILEVRPAGVDSCTNTNALDENKMPVRFAKDMQKTARFVAGAKRGVEAIATIR